MATAALVDADIMLGRQLTEALDRSRVPLQGALWFYSPEASEWRFIIVTPLVDQKGPSATYAEIQRALKGLPWSADIPLRRISVLSPHDHLIQTLRGVIRTGTEVSGIRFTHNTINSVFIEDAYIYRLN